MRVGVGGVGLTHPPTLRPTHPKAEKGNFFLAASTYRQPQLVNHQRLLATSAFPLPVNYQFF